MGRAVPRGVTIAVHVGVVLNASPPWIDGVILNQDVSAG